MAMPSTFYFLKNIFSFFYFLHIIFKNKRREEEKKRRREEERIYNLRKYYLIKYIGINTLFYCIYKYCYITIIIYNNYIF